MTKIIQAKLDDETIKFLKILKEDGYSESEAIREGIKILSLTVIEKKSKKKTIIGLGKFQSDVDDLASNKKHLKGFGNDLNTEVVTKKHQARG